MPLTAISHRLERGSPWSFAHVLSTSRVTCSSILMKKGRQLGMMAGGDEAASLCRNLSPQPHPEGLRKPWAPSLNQEMLPSDVASLVGTCARLPYLSTRLVRHRRAKPNADVYHLRNITLI